MRSTAFSWRNPRAALVACFAGWLISAWLFATPSFAQSLAIDKVLLVVNQEPITLSEYQTRHQREALQKSLDLQPFDDNIDQRLLNRMIDERIQAQAAWRNNIRIAPAEIDRAIAFVAEQNDSSVPQLLAHLNRNGISTGQFRESIREQQLINRLLEIAVHARVNASPQEIENYLARHPELSAADEAYEISHLLVSLAGKSAQQARSEHENLAHLRQRAVDGRPFAQLVRDFSDNPDHQSGGYLGWRTTNQLPEQFMQALRELENGQVSEIITSHNGLHLLKLHARRGQQVVEQQHLRHILIRPSAVTEAADQQARQLAEQLYQRIAHGADFQKIAHAYSADQGSGANGGDLGWVTPGEFSPQFEQAARALQSGEVSRPVRTQSGYHIIQAVARRRHDINRDRAWRRAQQAIFRRKAQERYENWYGPLREAAYIEYIAVAPPTTPTSP